MNFILPTQAPGAFVADGTAIIIAGAIIIAYFAYKYLKNRQVATTEAEVKTTNKDKQTDFVRPQTNTFNVDVGETTSVVEESVYNEEKEMVMEEEN